MPIDPVDQMVSCMHRLVEDGDLLAEGIGTFLPTAAYMLAKLTHAPHCLSLCPNGNTLVLGTRTLSLGRDEFATTPEAVLWLDYVKINLVYMPTIFIGGKPRWTEFMRPAQIDPWGWTNNVTIGPWERPRVRLPGAAGISDASPVAPRMFYYVPRHTREVFVPQVDFKSGVGNLRGGERGRCKPITVVTDLCVMVSGLDGRLRVESVHEGVERGRVQEQTGFRLLWAEQCSTTPAPNAEELDLLNTRIDPLGLRYLERLKGEARRRKLKALAVDEHRGQVGS
jgi:acyl CoA:acetate/3-ketoacid CoA transferase beta subunit